MCLGNPDELPNDFAEYPNNDRIMDLRRLCLAAGWRFWRQAPGRSQIGVGYRISATAQLICYPPAPGHPEPHVSKRAARAKPHNLYAPPAQDGEVHHDPAGHGDLADGVFAH